MSNISTASGAKARLNLDIAEAQEYDYIILNNPVFVNGYALAAAVGGAVDCKNAVMLALAGALLIIPVRLLGELTVGVVKARLRIAVYALLSALLIIPVMLLVGFLFPTDLMKLGLYLPLLFLDSVVLFRATERSREGSRLVFGGAFSTAAGYSLALLLIGLLRELLATGCVWKIGVFSRGIWPAASGIAGGLIITGLLCAVWQSVCRLLKKVRFIGGHDNE